MLLVLAGLHCLEEVEQYLILKADLCPINKICFQQSLTSIVLPRTINSVC